VYRDNIPTDDFACGEESVKRVDLDEVASLPLVQTVLRQRVDVPLNQRRSKRRRRSGRRH